MADTKEEYVFNIKFFVKEVDYIDTLSTIGDVSNPLIVGVRLLDFPTVLIYPELISNYSSSYNYPRGKSCKFIMTKDQFIKLLKTASQSIQVCLANRSHDSLHVQAHGVLNDAKTWCPNVESVVPVDKDIPYLAVNKTYLVPVFGNNDTTPTRGHIILKIRVDLSIVNTSWAVNNDTEYTPGHITECVTEKKNCFEHFVAESTVIGRVTSHDRRFEKDAASSNTGLSLADYLPNVWFPPPLQFTAHSISTTSLTSLSKQEDGERDHSKLKSETSLHWSAMLNQNINSWPWKGFQPNLCPQTGQSCETSLPSNPGTSTLANPVTTTNGFPVLSTLFNEVITLQNIIQGVKQTQVEVCHRGIQTECEEIEEKVVKVQQQTASSKDSPAKFIRSCCNRHHSIDDRIVPNDQSLVYSADIKHKIKDANEQTRKTRVKTKKKRKLSVKCERDTLKNTLRTREKPVPVRERKNRVKKKETHIPLNNIGDDLKDAKKTVIPSKDNDTSPVSPVIEQIPDMIQLTSFTQQSPLYSGSEESRLNSPVQEYQPNRETPSPSSSSLIDNISESRGKPPSFPYPIIISPSSPSISPSGSTSPLQLKPHISQTLATSMDSLGSTELLATKQTYLNPSRLGQKVYLAASLQSLGQISTDQEGGEEHASPTVVGHQMESSSSEKKINSDNEGLSPGVSEEFEEYIYQYSDDFESDRDDDNDNNDDTV